MELINLERILPIDIIEDINEFVKNYTKGEEHKIIYGQLFVGQHPISNDVTIDLIINVVCDFFKTRRNLVFARTRVQPYMKYRQVIAWLIKKYTDLNLVEIGLKIGGYDHATVIHGINAVNNYIRTEHGFRKDMNRLDEKLQRIFLETNKDKS